jgi:RYK receptor-like tyrosine kinase
MVKESCVYQALKHKNILAILGMCIGEPKRPLALYAYPEIGNLKKYLLSLKLKSEESTLALGADCGEAAVVIISLQEILFLVLQILKGVNYLHSKHLVHKDIATRNCWLDSNFALKLGDCALARDIFPQDYHNISSLHFTTATTTTATTTRPIKWMSLESIENGIFNVRTDIWTCGVVIWECFMLAEQPYSTIEPDELADHLNESELTRLQRPSNCPRQLYEMYVKCWHSTTSERPTLKELFYSIHKFYTNLNNYV